MSKDRYSDDHTIEILQDNDFTVITGGDIISTSTAGNIASVCDGQYIMYVYWRKSYPKGRGVGQGLSS